MISKFELTPEEGIVVNNAVTRHAARQDELKKEFVLAINANDAERNAAILPVLQKHGKNEIPATLALQPKAGVFPCQLAWEEQEKITKLDIPLGGNGDKKGKNRIKEAAPDGPAAR